MNLASYQAAVAEDELRHLARQLAARVFTSFLLLAGHVSSNTLHKNEIRSQPQILFLIAAFPATCLARGDCNPQAGTTLAELSKSLPTSRDGSLLRTSHSTTMRCFRTATMLHMGRVPVLG